MITFNLKERMIISKKITYLLQGGISLIETITLIGNEQKGKKQRYFMLVGQNLIRGKTFSESLGTKNILFDTSSIHLIRVGEMTGTLAKNFQQITSIIEKKRNLRSKIQAALIYPAIIVSLACVLIIVLLVVVFPRIVSVFGSMHATLPLITRIFIQTISLLKRYGLILAVLIIISCLLSMFLLKRRGHFRLFCEKLIFSMPIIRGHIQTFILQQYCSMFGLLLQSGMSIAETTLIMEEASGSLVYKISCKELHLHTQSGKKLSDFFRKRQYLFPIFLTSLMSVGEQTGNLSNTFSYLAEIYQEASDESLKKMTALIEPMLMIFIGVFIGALALAIISPVYALTSSLSIKP